MTSDHQAVTPPTDDDDPAAAPGRWRDRLLIALFLVVLSAPVATLLLGVQPGNYLNRTLAPLPVLTVAALADGGYFAGIDRFLNENLPIRPDVIELKAAFQYRLIGESPNPNVIPGRDGWLFHVEEIRPGCVSTAADVLRQADELAAVFAASGRTFRMVVTPDKRTIYPEKLPSSLQGRVECTDVARPELRAGIAARPDSMLDLWGPVMDQKARLADTPIYWAHDTHWNTNGAIAAVRAIVEDLAPGIWAPEDVVTTPAQGERVGDLTRMIGLRNGESIPGVAIDRSDQVIESSLPASLHFASSGEAPVVPGKTLFIDDSFFETTADLFAPWFEDVRFLYIGAITPEALSQIGEVDTIIVERVERAAYITDYATYLAPLIAHLDGEKPLGADEPSLGITRARPEFIGDEPLKTSDDTCSVDAVNRERWDGDEWSAERGPMVITGWAADTAALAVPQSTYVKFTDEDDREFYAPTMPRKRPDVATAFEAPELEAAGYVARFSTQQLHPGRYRISIVMDLGSALMACESGRTLTLAQ